MFEPLAPLEDSFDMHFYILVDDASQWPTIEYATVITADADSIEKLIAKETESMDVLLACSNLHHAPVFALNSLYEKFRISLNLRVEESHLKEVIDSITALCWSSCHSSNFDILDASNLLDGVEPILVANENMIKSGWTASKEVNVAILLLHSQTPMTEKMLYELEANAETALGKGSIGCVAFGGTRNESRCNYSVLAKI